jgi:hypothetical protein
MACGSSFGCFVQENTTSGFERVNATGGVLRVAFKFSIKIISFNISFNSGQSHKRKLKN